MAQNNSDQLIDSFLISDAGDCAHPAIEFQNMSDILGTSPKQFCYSSSKSPHGIANLEEEKMPLN